MAGYNFDIKSIVDQSVADQAQLNAERADNLDRYQIKATDDQYAILNSLISNTNDPVEAENMAYRAASAIKYSQIYGMPVDEAFINLEQLNAAQFGEGRFSMPKDSFTAICNAWQQGLNQLKRNDIGQKIRISEENGNFKYDDLKAELQAIDAENEQLDDKQSRNWLVNCLKYGAQLAPFTGQAIVMGSVGALLSGGIGAAVLGTVYSWEAMRGEEYLQLREDGASVDTAGKVADTAAFVNAIVETALGEVMAGVGTVAGKALTRSGTVTKHLIDKATKDVFKSMYYGGGWKRAASIATKTGLEYLAEASEEGIEEVVQELVSSYGRSVAASLDEYEEDPKIKAEIGQRVTESFKGGFIGALVLGVTNAGFNAHATVKDFKTVDTFSRIIDSPEDFKKQTADSPVFDGMSEEEKAEVQQEIFDKAAPARERRREESRKAALDTAETIDVGERTEDTVEDESAQVVRDDAYRTKEGKLNYNDRVIDQNENGSTENEYLVKGKGKEEYGRIIYNVDGNNVTISDFTMSPTRENLRQEVFTDFADKWAGYNIEWDTRGETAAAVKQKLINSNILGSKYGLNYFANREEVLNQRTRMELDRQIQKHIPSLQSQEERIYAIGFFESVANGRKMSVTEFFQNVFDGKVFTSKESLEAYKIAVEQGSKPEETAGWVNIKELENGLRAVIHASKGADVTTFMHEVAHVLRRMLTPEELSVAEDLFGVKNHDWKGTEWIHPEGTKMNAEEAFAYKFQDHMVSNLTQSKEVKTLFDKLAEILSKWYTYIKNTMGVSPEISAFFDSLLADPTNAFAQATIAIQQNDIIAQQLKENQNNEVNSNINKQIVENESLTVEERSEAAVDEASDTFLQLIPESLTVNTDYEKNIQYAKSLYEKNETKENIFKRTGCVIGADGVWHYELDESVFSFVKEAVVNRALIDLAKLNGNIASADIQKQTWNVIKESDALQLDMDIKNVNSIIETLNHEFKTLGSLYKADAIYELKEGLKDLKVTFFNDYKAFSRAVQVEGGIAFNAAYIVDTDALRATISHELQLIMDKGALEPVDLDTYLKNVREKLSESTVNHNHIFDRQTVDDLLDVTDNPYYENARSAKERANFDHYKKMGSYDKYLSDLSEGGDFLLASKPMVSDVRLAAAKETLSTLVSEDELTRIMGNIVRYNGSNYTVLAVRSIEIRKDIDDAIQTGVVRPDSPLHDGSYLTNLLDGDTPEERLHNSIKYFTSKGGGNAVISTTAKAIFCINGSLLNCNPSEGCAWFCYATEGHYDQDTHVIRAELINYLVEKMPKDLARKVASEYEFTVDHEFLQCLRIFDVGDLSSGWVEFVHSLNDNKVPVLMFSKRPELLRTLKSDKVHNVLMLSLDRTNNYLAKDNMDLAWAYAFNTDPKYIQEDINFILAYRDHFAEYGGSILPIRAGKSAKALNARTKGVALLQQAARDSTGLPWVNLNLCPIDAGFKKIGKDAVSGEHNCVFCDMKGTSGCFIGRSRSAREESLRENIPASPLSTLPESQLKALADVVKQSVMAEYRITLGDKYNDFIKTEEFDKRLSERVAAVCNDILAGNDSGTAEEDGKNWSGPDNRRFEKLPGYFRTKTGTITNVIGDAGEVNLQKRSADIVRKQYEGTDQWMKAPNGEKTNLTENQWIQVRTPEFKQWFGDWENDPENASKVLDENGEPKVCYHGTRSGGFKEFITDWGIDSRNDTGAWFTDSKWTAYSYSGDEDEITFLTSKELYDDGLLEKNEDGSYVIHDNLSGDDVVFESEEKALRYAENNLYDSEEKSGIYKVFLNIKDPWVYDANGRNWDDVPMYWNAKKANGETYSFETEDEAREYAGENGEVYAETSRTKDIAKIDIKISRAEGVIFKNVDDEGGYGNGYGSESNVYVVRDPNQVKSATQNVGDFSSNSGSILLQSKKSGLIRNGFKALSEEEAIAFFNSDDEAYADSLIEKSNNFDAENIALMDKLLKENKGLLLSLDDYPLFWTISKNVHADQPGEYQLTTWDEKGPMGHTIHNDAKSLVEELRMATDLNALHAENEYGDIFFQKVTEETKLKRLNSEPTVKAYRTMQMHDGKLYPPMAGKINVNGKLVWQDPIELNTWEQSEEHPELAKNGNFTLNKGNGKSVPAHYAPYFHSSSDMLNDQFAEAQDRPELVVVEVEIPLSELNGENPYQAEGSKKAVGIHDWPSGVLRHRIKDTRKVNLSRWDKLVRIVPNDEVVKSIADKLLSGGIDKNVPLPTNVFTPQVREGLEKEGFTFIHSNNKGVITEGKYAGLTYTKAYGSNGAYLKEKGDTFLMTVFHGSPYVIRREGGTEIRGEELGFDHSKMGTGEGAQAYGWGTYVTQVEGIAESYASMDKGFTVKSENNLTEEEAETAKRLFEVNSTQKMQEISLKQIKSSLDFYKDRYEEDPDNPIKKRDYEANIRMVSVLERMISGDIVKASANRNVYTLDIPDYGASYLQWENDIDASNIGNALYNYMIATDSEGSYEGSAAKYLREDIDSSFNMELSGEQIYRNIQAFTGSDETASKFLYDSGFLGISYPANFQTGGRDDGARNFVMFNEDDIQITEWHAKDANGDYLFQYLQYTLDRVTIEEAASFDTWEEWYEYAQTMDDEGVVTGAWDAVAEKEWFRNAWEYAKQIYGNNTEKATEPATEPVEDLDKKFISMMNEDGAIEDFVQRIRQYSEMAAGLSNPIDAEEAAQFDAIVENSDFISEQLQDKVWKSEKISGTQRKKILSLIKDAPKVYRGIYADVYDNQEMAVPIADRTKVDTFLDLSEDQIVKMDRMTPSQRRDMIKELEDEEIRNQVLDGTYKMDGSIDLAIDVAADEIKKLQAEIERLNEEYKDALDAIKNRQKKDFIEEYNRLLEMYDQIKNKNIGSINNALEAGKKGSSDAGTVGKEGQLLDIQRRMDQLQTLLKGERDAIAVIEKAKAKVEYQQKLRDKLKQRAIKAEIRRMRNGLIKSITRKVSFQNVYYDDAKQIIAAQDFMNDWIYSGVNQWIGKDTPFLRKVYSEYLTDEAKRKEIIDALSNSKYKSKATQAIQLLEAARNGSGKVYDDWTKDERKVLHIALGRTDWTNALNLESKDKYRREAMHGAYNEDGSLTDEAMALVEKILPPEMIANIQYKPMVGWTLEEMEALAKIIDDRYVEGKKVLAGMQQQRRDEIESIRDQIEKVVKDTGIVINPDDSDEDKKKKAEKIRKILGLRTQVKGTAASAQEKASLRERFMAIDRGTGNARRFARVMDNYSEDVFTTTLCFREYMAYDDEMKHLNDRTKYVQQWMKDNGLSVDELQKQHTFKGLMNGEDIILSTDDLLYIYVADKDEMSKAAVMYGNFGTAAEKAEGKRVDAVNDYEGTNWYAQHAKARYATVLEYANNLIDGSDKLKGFVNLIERDYASQYDRLNEASITVFNTPVNRVSNYVPLYRREMSGEENEKQVMRDLQANTTGAPASYVGRGMTINRQKIYPLNQQPVQLGLFKTWADSSAKSEHFIAYGGYVRDLNAIFTTPSAASTREVIASRYGDDANTYIKNYINELANPNKGQQRETLDRIVHVLRGKTAPAYLSWKASGIIKQLCTSPWPFMTYVSPASYLSALGKFMVPGNKMSEIVKEKSVYMANRTIDPIIDLIREAEQKADNKAKYLFAQINSTGMQGLEWADWISVAPGWYAAYENEKAQLNKQNAGKTEVNDDYLTDEEIEKKAVAKADDIVRLTQPSGRKADIAPLFKTSSEVARIILQFQTALNCIYQQVRFDIPYQIHNKQYGQVVRTILGYTLAGIVVNGVVSGYGDDDDDKDKLRKAVFYATTQFTDAVPVVGQQITNLAEKTITGKGQYSSSNLFPVLETLKKTTNELSDGDFRTAAELFGQGVAYSLGLPVSGWKEAKALLGIGDDDGKMELKPEALWGRR